MAINGNTECAKAGKDYARLISENLLNPRYQCSVIFQ
jgi:hypothetical protein